MSIPRKYLTIYVVIGSILIFSLKDALTLVHTALHTIPNPFHAHSFALNHAYLPQELVEKEHIHQEQSPHTHEFEQSNTAHHDVMDHIYRNQEDKASQRDKEEVKSMAQFTWDVKAFFSLQLFKPYQLTSVNIFFIIPSIQLIPYFPPSPPPELSFNSILGYR